MNANRNPLSMALGAAIVQEFPRRVYFTVTPYGRWLRWRVYSIGVLTEPKVFFLKRRAIEYARAEAKKIAAGGRPSGVRIKNRNGRIAQEWTYVDDPEETPG